jgi:adenylate cyclase
MTNASPDLGVILVAPVADSSLGPLVPLLAALQAKGHNLRQVSSEEETIAAAEADPPDLILLAVDQFDTAAMRVCHRLKKWRGGCGPLSLAWSTTLTAACG